jgi:uncharacterized protein (DUF1800 family)
MTSSDPKLSERWSKALLSLLILLILPLGLEAQGKGRKTTVLRNGADVTIEGKVASALRKERGKKGVSLRSILVKLPKKGGKKRERPGKRSPSNARVVILCLQNCAPFEPTVYDETLLKKGVEVTVIGKKQRGGSVYAQQITVAGSTPDTPDTPVFEFPFDQKDAARFLHQATFGPRRDEIEALGSTGFQQWFAQQLAADQCFILPSIESARAADPDGEVNQRDFQNGWWKCALNGNDQLRQRVAFALSQIFVVSFNEGSISNEIFGVAHYYDMLVRNAFGNYRQLLEEVTLHPVMGNYLSMRENSKADPATNKFPDENYAREIMQLFSIGLLQLNENGTLKVTPQGLPIPTYDQDVIKGYANVFTGWNYYQPEAPESRRWRWLTPNFMQPMVEVEAYHSVEEKLLLDGQRLPAGQTARQDLTQGLDIIFNHPNVPPFIARRLIQRLVLSNPSPDYISRVAAVFRDNGAGVRGDLAAVIKAILLDPEARLPEVAALPWYGKMKEPVIAVANLLRSFRATPTEGDFGRLNGLDSPYSLSQQPLRSPTVFNFYEPDYVFPGQLAAAGLVAPEFQITNDTTLISRISTLASYVLRVVVTLKLDFNFTFEEGIAFQTEGLIDHIDLVMTSGSMPVEVKQAVAIALAALKDETARQRVEKVLHLTVISSDFMIQR